MKKEFLALVAPWLAVVLMALVGWQLRTQAEAIEKVRDRQTSIEVDQADIKANVKITREIVQKIDRILEEIREEK